MRQPIALAGLKRRAREACRADGYARVHAWDAALILFLFPLPAVIDSCWALLNPEQGVRIVHPVSAIDFAIVAWQMAAVVAVVALSRARGESLVPRAKRPSINVAGAVRLVLVLLTAVIGVNAAIAAAGFSTMPEIPGASKSGWGLAYAATSAFAAAVVEEVIVTAYLLTFLSRSGASAAVAVVTVSAIRGLYHLHYGTGAVALTAFGAICAVHWLRHRDLLTLITAHAMFNALALGIGYVR